MSLPKFQETFIPILQILANGKPIQHRDLINKVLDEYYRHLPEELLQQRLKSGGSVILNRIGWGKSYLRQGKYIDYPRRGQVTITQKGIDALAQGYLNLQQLKKDFDFISKQGTKKEQKKSDDIDSSSPIELIEVGISSIEVQVKSELLDKLKKVNPYEFEKIILKLLNKMGYGEYFETRKSHDGGIDGIINQDRLGLEKIYIQAKRYGDNKVREKDIRNFIGAMSGDTSKGVFVTTSTFDDSAMKKAFSAHHVISLIDGLKLVELMFEHNIGIKMRETYEIKELDLDFFEEA